MNATATIIAALSLFNIDLLDADFATISEIVTMVTGLPCDTKTLGDLCDNGLFSFDQGGDIENLHGYACKGFSCTPTLAKVDGKFTARDLVKSPEARTPDTSIAPPFRSRY